MASLAPGGYHSDYLSTVEAYDPTTDTWSSSAAMPTARGVLAAASGTEGKIYAFGGLNQPPYQPAA